MKTRALKPLLTFLTGLLLASCNVDNPRIQKVDIKGNLQNIGGLTLEEFYSALENFSDDTALTVGTTAEGELAAIGKQSLNFNSGAIACRFSYERASFKVTVVADLALGQEIKTEITPISPTNLTIGTTSAKEICENDLATMGSVIRSSTLNASSERKLAAKAMIEAMKDLESRCVEREQLSNAERCDGLEYTITRTNFYSAGPAIASFNINLDLKTLQGTRTIELTFIPSGAAILTGGLLELGNDEGILSINAGSLGNISALLLANLK